MQDNVTGKTSDVVTAQRRTLWQRMAGNDRGISGAPMVVKIAIGIIILAVLMAGVVSLYGMVPPDGTPGLAIDVPKEWDVGWDAIVWIDGIVDWVIINWDPFFDVVLVIVIGILVPFRSFLLW